MLIKIRRNTKHVQASTLVSLIIAAFFGFLLVVYLIIDSGAADVAHAMLVIALGLPGLSAWHWIEGHYLLRRITRTHADQGSSSEVNPTPSVGGRHRLTSLTRVVRIAGGR